MGTFDRITSNSVGYGPGLLPGLDGVNELDHPAQIELLCRFAVLDWLPMFHEVIGGVVYRITSYQGNVKVQPIASKINDRVKQDMLGYTGAIAPELVALLEAPLLLPDSRIRRHRAVALVGHPLDRWIVRDMGGGANTIRWLYQEAQENAQAAKPTGYTAKLGAKYGFDTVIAQYRQLLSCLEYCEKFKFVLRIR